MIRRLFLAPFALAPAAALALAAVPAFADPAGVKVGRYLIVSPVEGAKAQEAWDLSRPIDRHNGDRHNGDKPSAFSISTARESRVYAQSDWLPAGLVRIANDKGGQPLLLRLWTRKGGPVFVKDIAEAPGVAAAYKINVGHESFVLSARPGGAIEIDGDKVGQVG